MLNGLILNSMYGFFSLKINILFDPFGLLIFITAK